MKIIYSFFFVLFCFVFFLRGGGGGVSFGDLVLTSVGYAVSKADEYVSRKKELEGRLCSLCSVRSKLVSARVRRESWDGSRKEE